MNKNIRILKKIIPNKLQNIDQLLSPSVPSWSEQKKIGINPVIFHLTIGGFLSPIR